MTLDPIVTSVIFGTIAASVVWNGYRHTLLALQATTAQWRHEGRQALAQIQVRQ